MEIEIKHRLARGDDLHRVGKRAHQVVQRRLHFQNDARAARRDQRRVTAELDRIAETLLGMQENSLACDFIRPEPQLL